jgi:hypothetical protein
MTLCLNSVNGISPTFFLVVAVVALEVVAFLAEVVAPVATGVFDENRTLYKQTPRITFTKTKAKTNKTFFIVIHIPELDFGLVRVAVKGRAGITGGAVVVGSQPQSRHDQWSGSMYRRANRRPHRLQLAEIPNETMPVAKRVTAPNPRNTRENGTNKR